MSANLSPLFTWRSAIAESDLAPTSKLVAFALSLHMNERGESCFPSQTTLAKETSLGERTVRYHLLFLERLGWIVREKRRGRSDLYSTTTPAAAAGVPQIHPGGTRQGERQEMPETPARDAAEDVRESEPEGVTALREINLANARAMRGRLSA